MDIRQLFRGMFSQPAASSEARQHDPYNQAWELWLRHFNGDVQQLQANLQATSPALSAADAQLLVTKIKEETRWAMGRFYDVRDGKLSTEQATRAVQEHLPGLSKDNLNGLVSYCQYSAER